MSSASSLEALARRLIPADSHPDGWSVGFADYVDRLFQAELAGRAEEWLQGLVHLDAEAQQRHQHHFSELTTAQQDHLLHELDQGRVQANWQVDAREWFQLACVLCAENYYADPASGAHGPQAGWPMLGYHSGPQDAFTPAPPLRLALHSFEDLEDAYDAIVVGSGAGGGVSACVLAEAGWRVLLVEAGQWHAPEAISGDHLRNHRIARYGHNGGPDLSGNPRVAISPSGRRRVLEPLDGGWHNNAMTLGGGTRVFGAQAWRFLPDDFRMASRYGVPAQSSLSDWPITYADLAPYYERAEHELGVCGQADIIFHAAPRSANFPMPPLPDTAEAAVLRAGAERLGISSGAPPLLINSRYYNGRPACVGCGACVGFACPSEGKTGSHNSVIPRALATGRCTLVTETRAARILVDHEGAAAGVELRHRSGTELRSRTIRARTVISSAGAIESARLLLASACRTFPEGLGNAFDQVGRHLQGHIYSGCTALLKDPVVAYRGPGVRIATSTWNHGNPGIIGGAMLANEFVLLPILAWHRHLPPDLPRWGLANKNFMREQIPRLVRLQGPTQEIPSPDSRVTLDQTVRDAWGIPAACLSGSIHEETLRTAQFMAERAADWARASGATHIWVHAPQQKSLSAGQHQAGTCRMGLDPRHSVCDPWGRVHGHPGLHIIDGSLHVTNGGFNPVLTIYALAYRCAEALVQDGRR